MKKNIINLSESKLREIINQAINETLYKEGSASTTMSDIQTLNHLLELITNLEKEVEKTEFGNSPIIEYLNKCHQYCVNQKQRLMQYLNI